VLTAQEVKRQALLLGADDVGIGSLDRFEGAPPEMDPRFLFPEARSIICLLFRIPRGLVRGLEEGTNFFQYPSMGYGGINEVFAPTVLYELGRYIEDSGWEAAIFRNTGGRGSISDMTGAKGRELSPELHHEDVNIGSETTPVERSLQGSQAVRPGLPPPDVFIHFRLGAYVCGLGEIGYSKMFLSSRFGPLNRQAFILTDAPLESDPLYDGPQLCNRCKACVADCPGGCISKDEETGIEIAGRRISWGKLDEWSCFAYYLGAAKSSNPFVSDSLYGRLEGGEEIRNGKKRIKPDEYAELNRCINESYPLEPGGYNPPKCSGCLRSCYASLERRGVLQNSFANRFRRKGAWKINLNG